MLFCNLRPAISGCSQAFNRVQTALEAVSAVHQLTSAFHTLSLCVRPLLIAGFPLGSAEERGMIIEDGNGSSAKSLTAEQV